MPDQVEGRWVVPNPSVPRKFGTMNIVFGFLLFFVGAGHLAWYALMAVGQNQMVADFETAQRAKKVDGEMKLAELTKTEAAANAEVASARTEGKTDRAKAKEAAIAEESNATEIAVERDVSAVTGGMWWNVMDDSRLAVYYSTEIVLGMVLNVLMAASGFGLLLLAEWCRRLAIGVACAKIARWVAMAIAYIIIILPIETEKLNKYYQALEVQVQVNAGGMTTGPTLNGAAAMAVMSVIKLLSVAVAALIYPALSVWFLTRPSSRAACLQVTKPIH